MEKNNLIVKAVNKNVRSSPRKLALVLNFIKGKNNDDKSRRQDSFDWFFYNDR